jgi:hypothetical protein
MSKNKGVKESVLDTMRAEAMDAADYSTVRMLNEIETEMENKLLKERLKGIFGGYGSAMAGFAIGAVVINQIKSKAKGT